MQKLRNVLIVLGALAGSVTAADAQVSIGIGFQSANIGFSLSTYPDFAVVPGYPVYYAPQVQANLFFYDGMYWAYQNDNWYTSAWYNGPWDYIDPEFVPLFILRVPVQYYRQPPMYFRGWRADAPPRWGDHWGHGWEQHRSGWDRWNRRAAPAPAPLPTYQRQYSGNKYPRQVDQQRQLIQRNYRYRPSDPVARKLFQGGTVQGKPTQQRKQAAPADNRTRQQNIQRNTPQNGSANSRTQPPQTSGRGVQKSAPADRGTRQQTIQRNAPQHGSANSHTPSPQTSGMGVQRSAPPASQQGRQQVLDNKQQPVKGTDNNKKKKKKTKQSTDQQDQQQGNGATNDPKHEQQQGRDRNRNQ